MGLDMYLYKKKKGLTNYEEVAYWRKANQIHAWFVNYIQDGEDDCGSYQVTPAQLEYLITDCKTALSGHSKAESILPSQAGFFFGSTNYDEGYFEDLEDTVKMLQTVLLELKDGEELFYQSSW